MSMTAIPDLIPDEFGVSDVTTPVSILRRQATALSEKTKGLVEGHVESEVLSRTNRRTGDRSDMVSLQFYVVAPVVQRYRRLIFTVQHDAVEMYPATITSEIDPAVNSRVIESEMELLNKLTGEFQSDKFKAIVRGLLILSREVEPNEVSPDISGELDSSG